MSEETNEEAPRHRGAKFGAGTIRCTGMAEVCPERNKCLRYLRRNDENTRALPCDYYKEISPQDLKCRARFPAPDA